MLLSLPAASSWTTKASASSWSCLFGLMTSINLDNPRSPTPLLLTSMLRRSITPRSVTNEANQCNKLYHWQRRRSNHQWVFKCGVYTFSMSTVFSWTVFCRDCCSSRISFWVETVLPAFLCFNACPLRFFKSPFAFFFCLQVFSAMRPPF